MSTPYDNDETSATVLLNERAINAAVYIGATAYGLHTAIFYQSASALLRNRSSGKIWLPFIVLQWAMSSINIACSVNYNQLAWIDERGYPGGPLAFIVQQSARPVNTVSIATSVVTLFLCDAFLVYRCHALWKRSYVTAALGIFLVASTVLSILHCIQAARPDAGLWDDATVKISIPYASVSMTLNVLLTVMLSWRLLDLRRKLPPTLNAQATRLTTLQALVVETALPFGLASFIFIILYGLRSAGANLFVPLLVQLEGITPALIVVRIVRGEAWSSDKVRSTGPASAVFRGSLGRSPSAANNAGAVRDDISMITLHDDNTFSGSSKLAREMV